MNICEVLQSSKERGSTVSAQIDPVPARQRDYESVQGLRNGLDRRILLCRDADDASPQSHRVSTLRRRCHLDNLPLARKRFPR